MRVGRCEFSNDDNHERIGGKYPARKAEQPNGSTANRSGVLLVIAERHAWDCTRVGEGYAKA